MRRSTVFAIIIAIILAIVISVMSCVSSTATGFVFVSQNSYLRNLAAGGGTGSDMVALITSVADCPEPPGFCHVYITWMENNRRHYSCVYFYKPKGKEYKAGDKIIIFRRPGETDIVRSAGKTS